MRKENDKNNNVQKDLIIEFFKNNPNRDIKHPEVVDWVVSNYLQRTGNVFRDPDRAIRHLSQNGFLIKIAKGIYKYDPSKVHKRELEDFTTHQKIAILDSDHFHSWYADFKNENIHYVIYRNKIFKIDRTNEEDYLEARKYGLALGIPSYQIDFEKNVKKFEQ